MIMRRAFQTFAAVSCAALVAAVAYAAVGQWRAGVNYRLLEKPQAPTVESGKVEVAEVFWYGCGHCAALDPALEKWNTAKPDYIEFVRVPVIWGPVHRQHAKLYYTLQALRRPELHGKVFEAIHHEGLSLSSQDEVKARALQFAFCNRFGVSEQQFDAAYDSMTVAMNVRRAETLTRTLRVDNVPLVFIQGKYVSSVSEAGGETQLISLINDLAAGEKQR
jgi:thiol:disulfide interchange protein DsbA